MITLIATLASSLPQETGLDARPVERESRKIIANAIGMQLAPLPADAFQMGSTDASGDEKVDGRPRHGVSITRSVYIGVYEVTQAEYREVMRTNPSYFSPEGKGKAVVIGLDTDRFPVERVKGTEAIEFCRRLSELPEEKAAGRVYRLPTEAEWEFACRGGGRQRSSSWATLFRRCRPTSTATRETSRCAGSTSPG